MSSLDGCAQISLTGGYSTVVDNEDFDLARLRWHVLVIAHKNTVYALRHTERIAGVRFTQYLHRVILSRKLRRELLRQEHVDHINGDGLDNRRGNLRLATPSQNAFNAPKGKRNSSGFRGVYFHNRAAKWAAQIRVDGQNHYLGLFDTPESAYSAYCDAARKFRGEFAHFDARSKSDEPT